VLDLSMNYYALIDETDINAVGKKHVSGSPLDKA
jgi:hypothetical protein